MNDRAAHIWHAAVLQLAQVVNCCEHDPVARLLEHLVCFVALWPVKKQRSAQPGQMVVAQTPEGEATLKYWHPEAHRIRLQPANSSMQPIYVKEASVLGVVVGVVRNTV